MPCELCVSPHPKELWRDASVYVIDASQAGLPGFIRVVLTRHIKEMTDLTKEERGHVMDVVFFIEGMMRRYFATEKINLAEFGNMTPHLHWHIIARFADDEYFPDSVWSLKRRAVNTASMEKRLEDAKRFLEDLPGLLNKEFC